MVQPLGLSKAETQSTLFEYPITLNLKAVQNREAGYKILFKCAVENKVKIRTVVKLEGREQNNLCREEQSFV